MSLWGKSIEPFLPNGEGSDILKELMEASWIVLRNHPVNVEREETGIHPANCLWLWGAGKAMEFPSWTDRWSMTGLTISTVDLHLGVGMCAGFEAMNPQDHQEVHPSDPRFYAKVCPQSPSNQRFCVCSCARPT